MKRNIVPINKVRVISATYFEETRIVKNVDKREKSYSVPTLILQPTWVESKLPDLFLRDGSSKKNK